MTVFDQLVLLLENNQRVIALALVGSQAHGIADKWSDWDCVIVAENASVIAGFFEDLTWTANLGELFTHSQSQSEWTKTLRLCFTDFQRLDLIFTTASALEQIGKWQSIPFWRETVVIFSQSARVSDILAATYPPPPFETFSLIELNELANIFYFKAQLAVFKIIRADRLIALHLILDLQRDVAVLVMLIRDEKEQTRYHRTGGWGNLAVGELPVLETYQPADLLIHIENLGHEFDKYAQQLHDEYEPKSAILSVIIENLAKT